MRHLPLVLGILLGHLALPAPTDASTADAYKGWRVASLNIEGLDSELSDPLREGLQLAGQNELFGRDYPVFYPNLLDQDVIRCRLYLARNGYPRARVDARVRAASGKDQRVDVTLQVVPGPAVRVHEVLLTGEPVELTRTGMFSASGAVRKCWSICRPPASSRANTGIPTTSATDSPTADHSE